MENGFPDPNVVSSLQMLPLPVNCWEFGVTFFGIFHRDWKDLKKFFRLVAIIDGAPIRVLYTVSDGCILWFCIPETVLVHIPNFPARVPPPTNVGGACINKYPSIRGRTGASERLSVSVKDGS